MSIIDFKSTKCKHCYKCVRNCLVKAIQIKDERAEIMEDHCILCGQCLKVCPQKAKSLSSELPEVREMIRSGRRVVVTMAPSFMGLMKGGTIGQIRSALKQLGFEDLRETSEGAAFVTAEYEKLLQEGKMENIITTCCPGANDLIEKYYPQLVPFMAPVVSPMVASGLLIRKELGDDVDVVFLGPCIAKKKEAADERNAGVISHVLNFDDITEWLKEKGIDISRCSDVPSESLNPKVNRLYPVTNGIVTSVMASQRGKKDAYRKFYVSGEENCMELCRSLIRGELHRCFIEMNICAGGCIKGPAMKDPEISRYKIKIDMQEAIEAEPVPAAELRKAGRGISFLKSFGDRSVRDAMPTEAEIREILRMTDKTSPEDELNCGACGYSTCRDKAIAVFQHKAELEMCIPFMHSRAESLSNIVLETSPNAVVMVDSEMKIIEFSRASEKLFRKTRAEALKMYLVELIDPSDALYVYDSHADVRGRKVEYPDYQICTMQNIVYIPKQDAVLLTITDITQQEKEAALDYEQKMASAEMAQKVIEKQMTVAQQIAGLLGETTAETKTTLTKMCRSILKEGPEKKENLSEESESDKLRNFAQPPKVDTTYNDNSIVHDMGGDESGMGEL
ncbi:MAG: 4Fe-4S binding protein [Lachnospiraceae bacterium]|jgi:iron only hydrogenase large subunit-like protein/uncharacterized Fe-S cluster-containing protein|nr:4Fe-4S binding protein [Lachnospiraceae bacterium]MCI1727683.1 4Fe-4S binding protein [Lachnospiraceae bacterium]